MADPHPLFDDTSAGGGGGPGRGFGVPAAPSSPPSASSPFPPSASFLSEPVSSLAVAYGSSLANQGRDILDRNVDRLLPVGRLKYYFAVDSSYVGRKLGVLLCPFRHQDWQLRYQQDVPVAPRLDVNAPDLYIPVMAFITFILLTGVALGTQNRFSPDSLGLEASSALAWLVLEVVLVLVVLYLLSVSSELGPIDLLAFSGYKYVGMILGVLSGLLFGPPGYYLALAWCGLCSCVFMIRTLRLKLLPEAGPGAGPVPVPVRGGRNQARMYLTVALASAQPLLMFGLTRHLLP